jgi:hypothetical protein
MLRAGAADAIVAILNNEEDRLIDLSQRFVTNFDFSDRIAALAGVSLLLRDGLLDHRQQIVAVWLLYSECEVSPITDHPFFSFFQYLANLRATEPNFLSPQLQDIVACIVQGADLQLIAAQPVRIIVANHFVLPPINPDICADAPPFSERISALLTVPQAAGPSDQVLSNSEILIALLQEEGFWDNFDAPTVHGCPDVCPVFREEVCFIDSYSNPRFLFDDGVPIDSRSSVTALITKAIETRLRQGECDSLLAQLRIDPSLADEVAIPCAKIASLIENNPDIAKEVIVASVKKPGVIKAVLGADVTLASVDVVKHLIVSRQAPASFLESYITNSTKALAVIQNQQLRGRKARFFCKMITFIIQSGEKLTPTMIMDLNSFCVEKAKTVKEAQELNTLLMNYT